MKNGMRLKIGNSLVRLCFLYAVLLCLLGVADFIYPDAVTVIGSASVACNASEVCTTHTEMQMLGGMLPLKRVKVTTVNNKEVAIGGMLFGVHANLDGVLVIGFDTVKDTCPAKEAGIVIGDRITAVNGEPVTSAETVSEIVHIAGTQGQSVTLEVYDRADAGKTVTMKPEIAADGLYKIGIWTKDAVSGIGTVTYIDPETGMFGGLGHGICDTETGELLHISRGTLYSVATGQIVAGKAGIPGELRGYFRAERKGCLTDNTYCGVFGVLTDAGKETTGETVPIGLSSDIREGEATLYCSLDGEEPTPYTIAIKKLYPASDTADADSSKNFMFEVTDAELLAKTGGIIQGMSGAPIVQNGKLVGAVTHVLVNHPERGYGIYLETMLRTASAGTEKAA